MKNRMCSFTYLSVKETGTMTTIAFFLLTQLQIVRHQSMIKGIVELGVRGHVQRVSHAAVLCVLTQRSSPRHKEQLRRKKWKMGACNQRMVLVLLLIG